MSANRRDQRAAAGRRPTEQEPVIDERGDQSHPAYALLSLSRVSSGKGKSLFKSEIRHQHYVSLTLRRAVVKRDLSRDWVHPTGTELITLDMSMAQWGQLVSSAGLGTGTPVTLARIDGEFVPEIPYAHAVSGAPENAAFAVTSLSEAAEEIVEAAHADIEARLIDMASALPEGSLLPLAASEMLALPEPGTAEETDGTDEDPPR